MEYASAESIFIILRHVISVCNSVAHARSCQRTGIGGVAWRRVTELNLGRHEASCCTALIGMQSQAKVFVCACCICFCHICDFCSRCYSMSIALGTYLANGVVPYVKFSYTNRKPTHTTSMFGGK